jgi:signal transduction histidine kinase
MPQGGSVQVGVSVKNPANREHDADAPDGWICMSINDQGSGMSPETQARMFEPYFSTYGQDKDKGLGLTLVYGIVRRSGGIIECRTAPGEGTTFEIYFPRKLNADRKASR